MRMEICKCDLCGAETPKTLAMTETEKKFNSLLYFLDSKRKESFTDLCPKCQSGIPLLIERIRNTFENFKNLVQGRLAQDEYEGVLRLRRRPLRGDRRPPRLKE